MFFVVFLFFFYQSKHRRKKEEARLEEKRKLLLKKHPLQIQLQVRCKGLMFFPFFVEIGSGCLNGMKF